MIKTITSAHNPIIKELVKIKTDSAFRYEGGVVLIEGEKLIREVSKDTPLLCLLTTDEKWINVFNAKESYLITPALIKKISSTVTPEGLVAVAEMPTLALPKSLKKLLVLDRIQDPANVGALIRTAYALSWDGIFLIEGTADPFNDKAIRAAKGATFFLPFKKGTVADLLTMVESSGLTLMAADMEGEPLQPSSISEGIALVLGNEGQGITDAIAKKARKVSIPMRQGVDSLNVAASGAILMYTLGRE